MTSLPRPFCSECEKPLGATGEQVAVYGLTGEHYDCAMERIDDGRELKPEIFDAEWKPVPDKLEGLKACGWLAPDGKFYGCRSYIHIALGDALDEYFYRRDKDDPWRSHRGSSIHLEELGWGHISDIGFHLRDYSREPTQAQLDALWDWFMSVKDYLDQADSILRMNFEHLFRQRED